MSLQCWDGREAVLFERAFLAGLRQWLSREEVVSDGCEPPNLSAVGLRSTWVEIGKVRLNQRRKRFWHRRDLLEILDDRQGVGATLITSGFVYRHNHTLAIRRDGGLWAWGENGNGQFQRHRRWCSGC